MLLVVHIVTSSLLLITSIGSALIASNSRIQLLMLGSLVINTVVTFFTGVMLVVNGANLARLCVFCLVTVSIAVFSGARIAKSNQIKLEI